MIVNGRVVSLKRVAKYEFDSNNDDIDISKILKPSLSSEMNMIREATQCCETGFGYMNDEYVMGYNPLCQVSNYRNIVDCMKDTSLYIMLVLYSMGELDLYNLSIPHICNEVLMMVDLFALKKHGHAYTMDIVLNTISNILLVRILLYRYYSL